MKEIHLTVAIMSFVVGFSRLIDAYKEPSLRESLVHFAFAFSSFFVFSMLLFRVLEAA